MWEPANWEAVQTILKHTDFARVYVPTDFSPNQIKACFLREFSK